LLAVVFIAFTIVATFALRGARIDLTENKLYTIAPGTERILRTLDEPINLYFFFSEQATKEQTGLRAFAQRVRELLEEMAQRSNGKVRLNVIDPQPFSEEEDRAAEFGLSALPLDRGSGETFYLGLAGTNATDGREVINVIQPQREEFLEYDIASLVYRLSKPKRPKVGIMSSLPVEPTFDQMRGGSSPGWTSFNQIRELFEVRTIAPDATAIDDDVEVLVVVHPKDWSEKTLFAIDQFVMRGGKLLAFFDPQAEQDSAGSHSHLGGGDIKRASTLDPLLKAWGVKYDVANIVGDRTLALDVGFQQDQAPAPYIGAIGLNRASMNRTDVITSALTTINVMTAGALLPASGVKAQFEPLLQTSSDASVLPAQRFAFVNDPYTLLEGFKPIGSPLTIAARLHGELPSAFPNGLPSSGGTPLRSSKGDANVILVADTDLLADALWLRPQTDIFGQRMALPVTNNGDFLANALENLAGSSDLINIRGRQSFFRPFTRVEDLQRQAGAQLQAKKQELDRELQETETQLSQLQAGRSTSLTPEQEAAIVRFQDQRLRIRKELREVRRQLDVDIENLGSVLKVLNILGMPVLIALVAVALAWNRRRKLPSRVARPQPTPSDAPPSPTAS
jgi:ABC-type uncharacterized transport system involved in gliding motility auxiliary subunit